MKVDTALTWKNWGQILLGLREFLKERVLQGVLWRLLFWVSRFRARGSGLWNKGSVLRVQGALTCLGFRGLENKLFGGFRGF